MRVRDATVDDAGAIRTVHRESIRGLGTAGYTRRQVQAWTAGCRDADYAASIDAPEAEFVVAEDDGDVVGFGSLVLESPDGYAAAVDAEVTAVYVRPSVVRQGVGSGLYGELETRARAAGVEALGLTASRNAVPFYEGHGYERVREVDHEFSAERATGVTGIVVEMEKTL